MEKVDSNNNSNSSSYPSPRTSPTMSRQSSGSSTSTTTSPSHSQFIRSSSPPTESKTSHIEQIRKERGNGTETKRESVRAPMGPPLDPNRFESEEEWRDFLGREKVNHWHYLPLLLVVLPPLGAIVHGRAENWTDAMILILVCFYLYHLVRVPWDLYYASRSRRILNPTTEDPSTESSESQFAKKAAAHALKESELISLAMTVVAPVVGSYFLYLGRGMLSDPDRYINQFTISLFGLGTSIKPFLHLAELFRQRALFYQEVVHYPNTSVHLLTQKVLKLESDLSQLSKAFATKQDVRLLRDGVDVPLTQLSKAVRRYERKEEFARLSTDERFMMLDQRLESTTAALHLQSKLVDALKSDLDSDSHPLTTIIRVLNHMIGSSHHSSPSSAYKSAKSLTWYIFLPLNVSAMAVGWATNKAVEAGEKNVERVELNQTM